MDCFNHPDLAAVGVCKVCQKGVCHSCAADLGHGLACRNTHEELADISHSLLLRSAKLQGTARKSMFVAPVFYAVLGALFIGLGWGDQKSPLFIWFGAAFVAFGAVMLVANLRVYGKKGADAV